MKFLLKLILASFVIYAWVLICNTTASFLVIAYDSVENIPNCHVGGLVAGFLTGIGLILYYSVGNEVIRFFRGKKKDSDEKEIQ